MPPLLWTYIGAVLATFATGALVTIALSKALPLVKNFPKADAQGAAFVVLFLLAGLAGIVLIVAGRELPDGAEVTFALILGGGGVAWGTFRSKRMTEWKPSQEVIDATVQTPVDPTQPKVSKEVADAINRDPNSNTVQNPATGEQPIPRLPAADDGAVG